MADVASKRPLNSSKHRKVTLSHRIKTHVVTESLSLCAACGRVHVAGFNTDFLFLFVPVSGGLLLSRRLNDFSVHVRSKKTQDASQVSLPGRVVAQD